MIDFSLAMVLGLCFGFMFGIGCSLAILYSIYLGGYRKAVEDSTSPSPPKRFADTLQRLHSRRARAQAVSSMQK
jgi:hypothetical protein